MPHLALALLLALIVIPSAFLVIVPSPIDATGWPAPPQPSATGFLTPNDDLDTAAVFSHENLYGPEDVAVDYVGRLYAGTQDGHIIRMYPGAAPEIFATTGGRPLGLHFDSEGNLVVADAYKGLLRINPNGQLSVLATEAAGVPFGFTNDLDIATDGTIYFSDSSTRFDQKHYKLDLLEGRPHGRLLAYDPNTRSTRVLLDGLYFANGVALSADESFVVVAETWRYRLQRYWLTGPRAGTASLFSDNLPGFPDGVSSNRNGLFWVAIPAPRNKQIDKISNIPFLREVAARLPDALQPQPDPLGMVLAINESGMLVAAPQDARGNNVRMVTSAEQVGPYLYLGSLEEKQIVRWEIPSSLTQLSTD